MDGLELIGMLGVWTLALCGAGAGAKFFATRKRKGG